MFNVVFLLLLDAKQMYPNYSLIIVHRKFLLELFSIWALDTPSRVVRLPGHLLVEIETRNGIVKPRFFFNMFVYQRTVSSNTQKVKVKIGINLESSITVDGVLNTDRGTIETVDLK